MTKNNVTGKDAERLLQSYAAANAGKYGGDAQMLAHLNAGHEKQKVAARPGRRRRMITLFSSTAAVLVAALAVIIPLTVNSGTDPSHERVDGLLVNKVTETGLSSALGASPVIPQLEGYAVDNYKTFTDDGGTVKAYSVEYKALAAAITEKIEILCVTDIEFVFSKENDINTYGTNNIINYVIIRQYIDITNNSTTLFILNEKYIVTLNKHNKDLLFDILIFLDTE